MKLRNKKTGEIVDNILEAANRLDNGKNTFTLAEINAEWEDYDDTKDHWCVSFYGEAKRIGKYANSDDIAQCKQIGNYFETEEEAEKAVEKLKAWKRLKDKGFDFVGCFKDNTINYEFVERPLDYDEAEEAEQDLAFLFGGEE